MSSVQREPELFGQDLTARFCELDSNNYPKNFNHQVNAVGYKARKNSRLLLFYQYVNSP